jgi:anaerobic selenocysteine-containing dehydrogenase
MASLGVLIGAAVVADCSQFFPDRYDNPEYKVPEVLIVWGNNPVNSNPDGFFGYWVVDLMKRGTKLITIDPKLTWLAGRSELWIKIKPGTDGALALGMLNIIFQEDLYDHDFCDKWTYGLDELIERCKDYPVQKVSEITWVPEDKLVELARRYATAKPAAMQWGLAIDQQMGGVDCAHAMLALWAVTGNLDVPGGNVILQHCWGLVESNWTGGWGYDEILTEEQRKKRIGLEKYPLFNFGFLIASPDGVVDTMETDEPYPIKAIWIQSQNPLSCMGTDPEQTLRLLQKLDFVVDADPFMTPTAMAVADIMLPVAMWPERIGFGGAGYYLGAITKAIEPEGEARSDHQINFDIGKRFNADAYPWETLEQAYDSVLAAAGTTYQGLREVGWKYPEVSYRKYEKGLLRADGNPGFNTSTGRLELYSPAYRHMGYDPMPRYIEPLINPSDDYPYVFTSGARIQEFFHSEGRQIERLRMNHPDPLMYMHPKTAADNGIEEGQWAYAENQRGRFKMRAKFDITLDPRVVASDHGWWFPERNPEDGTFFGALESNANMLIPNICGEKGFGGNQKSSACKIYRAE